MTDSFRERVKKRVEQLGIKPVPAATEVGLERTFIIDIIKDGGKKSVRGPNLPKLARALQTTVPYLTMMTDDPEPPKDGDGVRSLSERLASEAPSRIEPRSSDWVKAAIQGTVQAGHFRQYEDYTDEEPVFEAVERDKEFPHARHAIFLAAGDSMNDLKPVPIIEGARLVTIDFEDLKGEVVWRDGMVIIVEQTRDGGHLREWSVKQVELFEDRVEYCPRSTNPRHKPIVVPRNSEPEDGRTVRVLAIVRKIYNDVPL